MRQTELLAPGGNLDSAMAALENGADAVYCGLQDFSARKGARNFNMEQLSRLRQWTRKSSKKLYVTLNTIVKEEEMPKILKVLSRLEELEVDSVILQDPGLARIMEMHFPGLERHGSTQMGVHNLSGLKVLKDMGFSRVVLPREMTLKEMELFRTALPDMELEVFIHGAQCYGFSGMCLASGVILGRSGNRGECGQICRTWFSEGKDRGYFLSSTDLWAGEKVLELQKMGIASLKIEGRMKSPAYTAAVSRYYRALLDGRKAHEIKNLEEDVRLAFARKGGTGHLEDPRGEEMVDSAYPGHRGLKLGEVLQSKNKSVSLKSAYPLSKRDGIMFLNARGEAQNFSFDPKGQTSVKAGHVKIQLPFSAPPVGTEMFKVQSHNAHSKSLNEKSLPLYKRGITAELLLGEQTIKVKAGRIHFERDYELISEESKSGQSPVQKIRQEFSKSAERNYVLNIEKIHGEQLDTDKRFIPPSLLKGLRQRVYKDLDIHLKEESEKRIQQLETLLKEDRESLRATALNKLPGREKLSPRGDIPYITAESHWEGKYLPLSPLIFPDQEQRFFEELDSMLKGDSVLGINNWGHILLFLELKEKHPDLKWFGDIGFLIANSQTALLLKEWLGEPAGLYGWIEDESWKDLKLFSDPGKIFKAPLFISRNCYRKHSKGGSCMNCSRDLEYHLRQKSQEYRVLVRSCLTWIFEA